MAVSDSEVPQTESCLQYDQYQCVFFQPGLVLSLQDLRWLACIHDIFYMLFFSGGDKIATL